MNSFVMDLLLCYKKRQKEQFKNVYDLTVILNNYSSDLIETIN